MAAFSTAPVCKERRAAKIGLQRDTIGGVVTRPFNIFFAGGEAAGGAGIVNVKIPSGCVVLAAAIKCAEANANSTKVELKTTTTGAIFLAATAPANTGWTTAAVTTPLATPAGVDEDVTATLSVGNIPAGGLTVQVSLICASIDHAQSSYQTQNT